MLCIHDTGPLKSLGRHSLGVLWVDSKEFICHQETLAGGSHV